MLKLAIAGVSLMANWTAVPSAQAATMEQVLPFAANPAVRQFDDPNLVFSNDPADRGAPLVVFLPGTHGRSESAPLPFLDVIAQQGYRVIFLTYDDVPSVNQVCSREPDAACAAAFRERRSFGTGAGSVQDAPAEAIVPRLTALLRTLQRMHPQAGWAGYLAPDGQPNWSRIVLSGLSQGAGMAAFIAKRVAVGRVVLFSGPADSSGSGRSLAPWLSLRSATPPERWWAALHARENASAMLAQAYQVLGIPAGHIVVFNGPPPQDGHRFAANPYHTSTVRMPEYEVDWRRMYGVATTAGR